MILSGKAKTALRVRYRTCPIDAQLFPAEIRKLSHFFETFDAFLRTGEVFWFRGHADLSYLLSPSALRYNQAKDRTKALSLLAEMKRLLESRLDRPPRSDDTLKWMQIAQHHGLPTRLLDWTQNAAVALYFACCDRADADGLVAVLNPIELNQESVPSGGRKIFNDEEDADLLRRYLRLDGRLRRQGPKTIAISPAWNSQRIILQQGFFTLHGSTAFDLDRSQAPSLLYLPILKEHKRSLLGELERVGIGEMFVFPEPEHVCSHLRRSAAFGPIRVGR